MEVKAPLSLPDLPPTGEFACRCGRCHNNPVKKITVGQDALLALPDVLTELSLEDPLIIVVDDNTYAAAGAAVEELLRAQGRKIQVFNYGPSPEPTESDVFALLEELHPPVGGLLAVGSGTINDLTRFVASRLGKPYVSVPTAPSMDGIVSPGAALLVKGIKRPVRCCPPLAVVADLDVLAKAPAELLAAGLGDIAGKLTANLDWLLAQEIVGDQVCPYAQELVLAATRFCLQQAAGLGQRTREAVRGLTMGLVLSGLAMVMVGYSRPASGSEHHIAQLWEMWTFQQHKKTAPHGHEVGVATVLSTRLYEAAMESGLLSGQMPSAAETLEERTRRIEDTFGSLASHVLRVTKGKVVGQAELCRRQELLQSVWERFTEETAKQILIPADQMAQMLSQAGCPTTIQELGYPLEWWKRGAVLARDTRLEYTILDALAETGNLHRLLPDPA